MHYLDAAFLNAALLELDRALKHIGGNDTCCDDLFAKLHVKHAISDIKCALGTYSAKEAA